MRHRLRLTIFFMIGIFQEFSFAQNSSANDLTYACNSTFWTIEQGGVIRQWDLTEGNITGGFVIHELGFGVSIAFAESDDGPEFYVPTVGAIYKYNVQSGWTSISTPYNFSNNGAFQNNHYLMQAGFGISLYQSDGTNFSLITSLTESNYEIAGADIAVDSQGRANMLLEQNDNFYIVIYDQTGFLQSFQLDTPQGFDSTCFAGLIMLNDNLYVVSCSLAFYPNSLIPILITENNAAIGSPIPFGSGETKDAASCNSVSLSTKKFTELDLVVYPNPSIDWLNVKFFGQQEIERLEIYSLDMRLVAAIDNSNLINTSNLISGLYYLKAKSQNRKSSKLFFKQ